MEHIQDVKFKCDNCEFEDHIQGYCPSCEEAYMKKVCECDSGDYAYTCCEPDLELKEKEMEAKLNKELEKEEERKNEELLKKEAERQALEDAELANQKEEE